MVTESINSAVHVVSLDTFFIVNTPFSRIPDCPFVHVTLPLLLSIFDVKLNTPFLLYSICFVESPFIVPFCATTLTVYLFISHIAYKSIWSCSFTFDSKFVKSLSS